MAFVPVPKVAQVNLQYQLYDQQVENTLYLLNDAGWDTPSLINAAAAVVSTWTTNMMPLLSAELSFENVKLVDLNAQGGLGVDYPVNPVVQGGVGGPSAPGNVAFCVKKATGYTGKSARGRIYLPGIGRSLITGNEVSASWRGLVVAALLTFQSAIESTIPGVHVVHVSRYTNGAPRIQGAYWNVVSYTADTFLDSQRRRLTGRGT